MKKRISIFVASLSFLSSTASAQDTMLQDIQTQNKINTAIQAGNPGAALELVGELNDKQLIEISASSAMTTEVSMAQQEGRSTDCDLLDDAYDYLNDEGLKKIWQMNLVSYDC